MSLRYTDIHCHLLPGLDDGARDAMESIAMAEASVSQGVETIVVTPHQLGAYGHNTGDEIRRRTRELADLLSSQGIALRLLPGADVRIEEGMLRGLMRGEVLTLGDHGKHVLLELPHELYLPLDPILDELGRNGMTGVLSHPERNQGLLQRPALVDELVDLGCLMQVTAGSFLGAFGPASRSMAERMARRGLVHFVATDAHGAKARRPRLDDARRAIETLAGAKAARLWCVEFPAAVAEGRDVPAGAVRPEAPARRGWAFWRGRAA